MSRSFALGLLPSQKQAWLNLYQMHASTEGTTARLSSAPPPHDRANPVMLNAIQHLFGLEASGFGCTMDPETSSG